MPKLKKNDIVSGIKAGNSIEQNPNDRLNYQSSTRPEVKLSLRLIYGSETALGPGKAELLEAIAETGSITAAGKSMQMSYRRAWLSVDEMNRCFKTLLVETAKGGIHGGGARLTPLGMKVLAHYRAMASASKQVALAYLGLFENLMADVPPQMNNGDKAITNNDSRIVHTYVRALSY